MTASTCSATSWARRRFFLWHKETELKGAECLVLPGGFSYGDYLRSGAMAACSPIMESVKRFAADGGLVLGICNGFQILTEAGLLPGALMRNASLQFVCRDVHIRVERSDTPFTCALQGRRGAAHPDRAQGRQLLRRPQAAAARWRRRARSSSATAIPRGASARTPTRTARWSHRRDDQRARQRLRADAASGARSEKLPGRARTGSPLRIDRHVGVALGRRSRAMPGSGEDR